MELNLRVGLLEVSPNPCSYISVKLSRHLIVEEGEYLAMGGWVIAFIDHPPLWRGLVVIFWHQDLILVPKVLICMSIIIFYWPNMNVCNRYNSFQRFCNRERERESSGPSLELENCGSCSEKEFGESKKCTYCITYKGILEVGRKGCTGWCLTHLGPNPLSKRALFMQETSASMFGCLKHLRELSIMSIYLSFCASKVWGGDYIGNP